MELSKKSDLANEEDVNKLIQIASEKLSEPTESAMREQLTLLEQYVTKRDLAKLLDEVKKERIKTAAEARNRVLKIIAAGQISATKEAVQSRLAAYKYTKRNWLIGHLRDLMADHYNEAMSNADQVSDHVDKHLNRADRFDNEEVVQTLKDAHNNTYKRFMKWHSEALDRIESILNEKIEFLEDGGDPHELS